MIYYIQSQLGQKGMHCMESRKGLFNFYESVEEINKKLILVIFKLIKNI